MKNKSLHILVNKKKIEKIIFFTIPTIVYENINGCWGSSLVIWKIKSISDLFMSKKFSDLCDDFFSCFPVFQWTYSSLLLVTVGSINGSYTDAQLIKIIPLEAKACSGSTVTISCNYDSPNITNPRSVKVKWFFNETFVEGERYRQDNYRTSSILTIIEVTVNDSGWYVCEVTQDIPVLLTQRSNKSNLTVFGKFSFSEEYFSWFSGMWENPKKFRKWSWMYKQIWPESLNISYERILVYSALPVMEDMFENKDIVWNEGQGIFHIS